MHAGATSAFDRGQNLESDSECAGSDIDSVTSAGEDHDRKQVPLVRDRVHMEDSEDWSDAAGPTRSVGERLAPEQEEPSAVPETVDQGILRADLTARRGKMFDSARSESVASQTKPIVSKVTRGLVRSTWLVLQDLSKGKVKALSKAFGNFDKVVALGRLLADAIGMPLLEHKRAHAVGLKASREAGKVKSDIDQVKRDKRREAYELGADHPKRQDLLAQATQADVEAPLLRDPVDVGLIVPVATARSAATGMRKRARESVEQDEDELSLAEAAVLECSKAVKRADAAIESANKAEESKLKVYARLANKLSELSKGCAKSSKTLEQFHKFSRMVSKAEREHRDAQMASKNALIVWLGALVKERDAELEVAELELDAFREGGSE